MVSASPGEWQGEKTLQANEISFQRAGLKSHVANPILTQKEERGMLG